LFRRFFFHQNGNILDSLAKFRRQVVQCLLNQPDEFFA
jgi:hypothetical protein